MKFDIDHKQLASGIEALARTLTEISGNDKALKRAIARVQTASARRIRTSVAKKVAARKALKSKPLRRRVQFYPARRGKPSMVRFDGRGMQAHNAKGSMRYTDGGVQVGRYYWQGAYIARTGRYDKREYVIKRGEGAQHVNIYRAVKNTMKREAIKSRKRFASDVAKEIRYRISYAVGKNRAKAGR